MFKGYIFFALAVKGKSMTQHKKSRFLLHLFLVVITGGLWLIPMAIWYFVKKV